MMSRPKLTNDPEADMQARFRDLCSIDFLLFPFHLSSFY